jgi:hypothetical protein
MPDETRDATAQDIALEDDIQRFEAEVGFRQSNILPLDYARNLGRFYGLLIRASCPASLLGRAGFLMMGILWVGQLIFPSLLSVLFALAGLKLIWTACQRTQPEPESNASETR